MESVFAVVIEFLTETGEARFEWIMSGPGDHVAATAERFGAYPFVRSVRIFPFTGEA